MRLQKLERVIMYVVIVFLATALIYSHLQKPEGRYQVYWEEKYQKIMKESEIKRKEGLIMLGRTQLLLLWFLLEDYKRENETYPANIQQLTTWCSNTSRKLDIDNPMIADRPLAYHYKQGHPEHPVLYFDSRGTQWPNLLLKNGEIIEASDDMIKQLAE